MLQPIPYHQKVKEHFQSQLKTWEYFLNANNREGQLEQFRQELLKNTYKFDTATDAFIYDKIAITKEKLGLEKLPVTVYQAQYTDELNASIIYLNGEAHIVFSGAIVKLLNEEELLAVLAHELTHVKLFSMLNGELEVADRIITSIANNNNSEAAYYETARIFRLYTEIFCDRGAYSVLNNIDPVISSLVKVSTGLEKINAISYLKQADEIFAAEADLSTAGISHPENFIRAKAIELWHIQGESANTEIAKLIEGLSNLDHLDIFKQQELGEMTRQLLQLFLKPKWIQTAAVLNQAKQYFADFATSEKAMLTADFSTSVASAHNSIKDYLAYVLFDFVMIDPSLEEMPAGWAFQFAEDVQLKEVFDSIIKKELKLSDKKMAQHKQKVLSAYYEVKENEGEQIYEG